MKRNIENRIDFLFSKISIKDFEYKTKNIIEIIEKIKPAGILFQIEIKERTLVIIKKNKVNFKLIHPFK
jgi:hypothetical protein